MWCLHVQEDWVLCRVFYKNREIAAKPSMGSCYDDTGSSSLPALMDSYISFDQAQFHADEYEQVPCFSIFSQNQTNPIFNNMEPKLPPYNNNNNNNANTFGGAPNLGNYSLDPLSCDRKVLKAVLTQLSKMERNNPLNNNNNNNNQSLKGSPSLGEGSSESYLSEVGMPHMWNNY